MAPRAFVLLALAFAVVLLITSEAAAAKEVAADTHSEISRGALKAPNKGSRLGGNNGDGKGKRIIGGGRGGNDYDGGRGGHKYVGGRSCGHGSCGGKHYGGCKGCNTFAEATAYKQTQN